MLDVDVVAGGVVPFPVAGVNVTVGGDTVLVAPVGVTAGVSQAARDKRLQRINNADKIFFMIFLRFIIFTTNYFLKYFIRETVLFAISLMDTLL